MKSRIGILATLVVGMLLSTAGAGLAIDGISSSSDNAGVAQYGQKPGTTNPGLLRRAEPRVTRTSSRSVELEERRDDGMNFVPISSYRRQVLV